MEIKIDTIIKNKFFMGYGRDCQTKYFVVHGTGGGGTLNWMRDTEIKSMRGKRYKSGDGLFHYLIERNGDIIEIINPEKWVYHSSVGRHDSETIGVELLNPSWTNKTPYTKDQYNSLKWLYGYVRKTYAHEMDCIISHNEMKKKHNRLGKMCPGTGFEWNKFIDMMLEDYIFFYEKEQLDSIRSRS